jgi:hypothetical protein
LHRRIFAGSGKFNRPSVNRQLSIGCADGDSATSALTGGLPSQTNMRFKDRSVMRYEHSSRNTPRLPLCPSCAQIMRLARTTSRFGNLPDLYVFECRACGVLHVDEAQEAA